MDDAGHETKRRAAKQGGSKRRSGHQRAAEILEGLPDAFVALDREWRYAYANPAAARRSPVPREEMLGRTIWEVFPERAPGFEGACRRAMDEGVTARFEEYDAPLGAWFEHTAYPSAEGITVCARDVTARKQAERRLAYHAHLLEIVHDAIIATDERLVVTAWNRAAEGVYGWAADEVIGRDVREVVRSELDAGRREEVLRVAAETGYYRVETVNHRKDGTPIHVAISVRPLRDAAGRVTGYVTAPRDITERKRAEESLRRAHEESEQRVVERTGQLTAVNEKLVKEIDERRLAEEKLRRSEAYLAEGQRLSHTGSWALDVSTGDLYWSEEHFRICGLDPEKEQPIYPAMDWIHPEDRAFVREAFEKAIRERSELELDCRVVRGDGSVRGVHSLAHPVFNAAGGLTEYVGTIIDNTGRQQSEEALREAQEELAHVTRVATMGELTASIAHEVNQPLGAIVTNGQACQRLLSGEAPDLGGALGAVGAIISDALRASQVIMRMRAFLKKAAPAHAPLDLNETIRGVLSLASGELVKNQVSLRTELEPGLPPVLGDRVQLQQVALNLLLNGVEAMRGEGGQPRELLVISRRSRPEEVTVAVRDTGRGISPRDAGRVFDAFFTTKGGGLGLGLTISRTITEAHGGRLWSTPNDGRGMTFQFTLPVSRL